jgi:Holliday junction DNA helicase RuvA
VIGRLVGQLAEKQPPSLLIDVNGVGYELEASMNTCFKLPAVGAAVTLYTHFVVREDAQLLYGFYDRQERTVFRALIKANGVGPKLALAILSGMGCDELIGCMQREDAAALTRIPGVGKKTAERLIVELKDKLKLIPTSEPAEFELLGDALPGATSSAHQLEHFRAEAESALLALGYKPAMASKAVLQAEKQLDQIDSSESLIRLALKSMVSGG